MLNLFSIKQKPKNGSSNDKAKTTAGELRIQKDVSELAVGDTIIVEFPNKDDLLNFNVTLRPDDGYYKGGEFHFTFKVSPSYPHEPPKVHCDTKVYHPNIDLDGNVCLNILREEWKPILTLNSVLLGLQFLFLEPNPDDPLNEAAADNLNDNKRSFEQNVQRAMRGGSVGGVTFDACLKR